jgi:hypothetical protein
MPEAACRLSSAVEAEAHPMPVDTDAYRNNVGVHHYINAYCQIRDVLSYRPRKVLIVGPGVGLEPLILRGKYGIEVRTLDIDGEFQPDYVGSVHEMHMFGDRQFDVAVASHVLEHLPFTLFRPSLAELARVAAHAVIYLPHAGRKYELRLVREQRTREHSLRLYIPPLKTRIDGQHLQLQHGCHYWELGFRGFTVKRIAAILGDYFHVDSAYSNRDWDYSYNFTLTSRERR